MASRLSPPPPPPAPPRASAALEDVAAGQRWVIGALALYLGAAALRMTNEDAWFVFLPVALVSVALGIVGLLRMSSGLGYSRATMAFLVVLAFVPLAGFVMLAMVNDKATRTLRAGGYKVGFFGARGRPTS
jgi:hypothetical protein